MAAPSRGLGLLAAAEDHAGSAGFAEFVVRRAARELLGLSDAQAAVWCAAAQRVRYQGGRSSPLHDLASLPCR